MTSPRPDPPALPVGRLAPSPTGRLHVGHARSFLLAWWSLRSRGGRVVLRVEDLDSNRVRPGAVDTALRDLEWLGLDWDGDPLLQSADLAPYQRAVESLLAQGLAYPCTCSRKEIEAALSAPHPEEGELRYPGTCRDRFESVERAEQASGSPAGLRLRVPAGPQRVRDELLGELAFDVQAEVGDFALARRDGVYAYQLAVVVDDARQGVTEVLRGADLLSSAPRQALVQAALGLAHPRWLHVPLVVGDDGRRLAKRREDLTLAALREAGVDARALVGWVARSAGLWAELRPRAGDLLAGFTLDALPPGPARFGERELASLLGRAR